MSWIFGFSGNIDEQWLLRISSIYPAPLYKYRDSLLFIAAGGNEVTCLFSQEQNWIVLGSGVETARTSSKLLNKKDWGDKIEKNSFDDLEGHFLLIKWENYKIKFYCDQIGLRTIYFYKHKTGIYFSSNPEWLTLIMGKVEIDFNEFGSRWLTFNQLSNDSFLYDIKKLPPASFAEIEHNHLKIETKDWFPPIQPSDPDILFDSLKKFIRIELPEKLEISFGLSGGLDSRFLLSLLFQNRDRKFKIHSYGYQGDADLQVAKNISQKLSLYSFFPEPKDLGSTGFFNKIYEYISATQLIETVSNCLKLTVFEDDYFRDKFLIDGALAEFARRQFLNRLLIKGKKSLQNKNISEIVNYLLVPKPRIFKEEYEKIMLEGAISQLKKIFEIFPDPGETGIENFLDLLIVKFRVPNYFGPEQARLDCILPGIIPFAQRDVISKSLGIPVKQRKNSKLFNNAIKKNYPELADFPLVKNSIIYPFGLSTTTSFVYTHIKKSFYKGNAVNTAINFYRYYEKEIREIINRDAVRGFKYYNEDAVMSIINNFYEGMNNKINDMDWLLTFELFRRKLNITS